MAIGNAGNAVASAPLAHGADGDRLAIFWPAIDSPRLGKSARNALGRAADGSVAIIDISLLELSMLERRGKLVLSPSAVSFLDDLSQRIVVLPIDAEIAAEAAALPLPHGDSFDRVIVATARRHRLALVTRDGNITDSNAVKTLW